MSWHLFDRIRSLVRTAGIYQQERLFQDQSSIDRIMAGGDLLDFSQQQALLDQTNLQINRLERYKDYDQMDETGEMSLALDLYADESSLVDPERKHTIIIKAQSKTVKEELENLFFNQLLIDNNVRPMVRYLCKYGDAPFEIVPTVDRDGVASIRFVNVYNFTRVETKHGDLVGFFYQDEVMEEPQFLHPWQTMHLRLTDYGNQYHPYGRCKDSNSPVWTPNGWKRLKDLKPGDDVFAWDGKKAVPTKVVKYVSNGIKKTIKVKTRHYSEVITPEHPVLVHKDGVQDYVLAKNLKVGDELVIPKLAFNDVATPIKRQYRRYKLNEKYRTIIESHSIGYKKCANLSGISRNITRGFLRRNTAVSKENADKIIKLYGLADDAKIGAGWGTSLDCSLPEFVDDEFARFFGFMIGDGWLSSTCVQFALGEDDKLNEYYINILARYSGESKINFRYDRNNKPIAVMANNTVLADTLFDMGLNAKAAHKQIPEWVFNSSKDIAINFVQGLLDSDGCAYLDREKYLRFHHVTASMNLITSLKILLHKIGVKCGHICTGHNHKFNSDELGALRHQLTYYQSELPFEGNALFERVISIEEGDEIEVGDIQVESEYHNFVADGIVIHNSIMEGGRKAFKQLRLMEDAALIYRITRAPEKRIFKIPIGNIAAKDVPEFMQSIARTFKQQRFYDPRTGKFNERFSPLIQEDDFFLPVRPDGTSPDITTLKGAENLDQIADIEYFKKKMIAPTKIPFKRVGVGEGSGEEQEKSLSSSDAQFAKAVQWVQREISIGLTKVAICHLAMAGYSIDDLKNFEISMSATSAIDELYRMETWQGRTAVMSDLKDLGWFPREWIVTRFTDLSPDEIDELSEIMSKQTELPTEEEGGGLGGLGGLGLPGGGEELPGLEGEGGLEGLEGAEAEGGAEAAAAEPPEADLAGLGEVGERLDKRNKNILIEIANQNKYELLREFISRVNKRVNSPSLSAYINLLNNNELDGLKRKDSENVLIESIIDKEVRDKVVMEFRDVLVER